VSSAAPTVTAIRGGGGKPSWAPSWAPSKDSLDYLQKLAALVFLALGALYFLGIRELKPFAEKHVAAV
jgi:hypothetical protein